MSIMLLTIVVAAAVAKIIIDNPLFPPESGPRQLDKLNICKKIKIINLRSLFTHLFVSIPEKKDK